MPRKQPADLLGLAAAAAAALLDIALRVTGWRALAFDEIEFARATGWVAEGKVPFRDFWEHHTPLQWYLFAPLKALLTSPGAETILWLRAAQLPLWAASLFLLWRGTRESGVGARAASIAFVTLAAAASFAAPGVEFRVDVTSCCALVGGWYAIRNRATRWRLLVGGALLSVAVLANFRFAPLAAVIPLAVFVDAAERRWRMPRWSDLAALVGGAAAVAAGYAALLRATGSLHAFVQDVIRDNATMGRMMEVHARPTRWIVAMLPFRQADLAGILLLAGSIAGLALVLRTIRTPDALMPLAALQLVSIAVWLRMPVVYPYHLVVVLLFALPFFALAVERAGERAGRIATVLICIASLLGLARSLAAGRDHLLAQDRIMRQADRQTAPAGAVFDGVGFALRRRPASQAWFLPLGVQYLVSSGRLPQYVPSADPPAAVIADRRAVQYLLQSPGARAFVLRNYVPVSRHLWLPGLAVVLPPSAAVDWIAPRDGAYEIIAAPELAEHLWFHAPMATPTELAAGLADLEVDVARFRGRGLVGIVPASGASGTLRLRKGATVRLASRARSPLGVFVVPHGAERLFVDDGTIDEPLFDLY